MKYTYQHKALLTTPQKLEMNLWLRICQYWYNRQLGDRFDWWEYNRSPVDACTLIATLPELRDKPNYYSQKKYLPDLKKQAVTVQWSGQQLDFSRVPANTLQEVCKRVDKAFERFIAGDSNGKRSGKPRFKSESRFRSLVVEGAGLELHSCSIGVETRNFASLHQSTIVSACFGIIRHLLPKTSATSASAFARLCVKKYLISMPTDSI